MSRFRDLRGQTFGRLTAVKRVGKNKQNTSLWLFKCDCGKSKTIRGTSVTRARATSCGCLHREIMRSVGKTANLTHLYVCWLYELLFWFRDNPDHLNEVDEILRFSRERGIATPAPAPILREPQPLTQSNAPGWQQVSARYYPRSLDPRADASWDLGIHSSHKTGLGPEVVGASAC